MNGLRFNLKGLTKYCVALSGFLIVCEVIFIAHSLWALQFISALISGDFDPATVDAQGEQIDSVGVVVSFLYLATLVIAFIVNGIWIYRASWNAREIQPATDRIKPGWAIGFFAVPLANLWLPFKAMRQTWNSSHDPSGMIDRPGPSLLGWWWVLWIVNGALGQMSLKMSRQAETLEEMKAVSQLDIVIFPIAVVNIILFIRILKTITDAQENKSPMAVVTPAVTNEAAI
jgi:Domain of unknown function (DUF4328)